MPAHVPWDGDKSKSISTHWNVNITEKHIYSSDKGIGSRNKDLINASIARNLSLSRHNNSTRSHQRH